MYKINSKKLQINIFITKPKKKKKNKKELGEREENISMDHKISQT